LLLVVIIANLLSAKLEPPPQSSHVRVTTLCY
jgi:hypothetical protein